MEAATRMFEPEPQIDLGPGTLKLLELPLTPQVQRRGLAGPQPLLFFADVTGLVPYVSYKYSLGIPRASSEYSPLVCP